MNILDTEEGKELMRHVEIGLDTEAFLRSPLGGFLTERLIDQRKAALDALESAVPEDVKAVRMAQNEAYVPVMILQSIKDAIDAFKLAEERLNAAAE